jgi:hypothetical protein
MTPDDRDSMAQEVDRLLKKLPGADPKASSHLHHHQAAASSWGAGAAIPRGAASAGPSARDRAITWIKVTAGAVFGALMIQWPYVRDCGGLLYGYLFVVLGLAVVGAVGAMASWRSRMALAHLISLTVILWSLALAAGEILPRIGYAAQSASWSCPVPAAPAPTGAPPTPTRP